MTAEKNVLVKVENLKKYFPIMRGIVRRKVGDVKAVDGVSFDIYEGETLGESGCGKSTTGRVILQLYPATSGEVIFKDQKLTELKGEDLRKLRPKMQMIFQDPHASLNPRMTVGSIISEPLDEHSVVRGRAKRDRVEELLNLVGLNPMHANRYPHEFSGGQRQKLAIARVFLKSPNLLIMDEATSALDNKSQGRIQNFLDTRLKGKATVIAVVHRLDIIKNFDQVAVMKAGKLMEIGTYDDLMAHKGVLYELVSGG